MPLLEKDYKNHRLQLLRDYKSKIIDLEQKYTSILVNAVLGASDGIHTDFCQVNELKPFWINYPPQQRGRKPSGTSLPWGDLGEKTVGGNVIRSILHEIPSITFPGLPLGGDVRFATNDALFHFDLKLTGPNDNPDEIVASPHQISGDGKNWYNNGVANSSEKVIGNRAEMQFQPELPPLYMLDGEVLICLTYFLKAVYLVKSLGDQPLSYMELVCVPNGLLMFDGPCYANTQKGLLIPGKDVKDSLKKRTRVRLQPLAQLANWRCIKIIQNNGVWQSVERSNSAITNHNQQ